MPVSDVPVSDVPVSDVPVSDVPAALISDLPTAEIPVVDVPLSDLPTADVPTVGMSTAEVPTAEVPTAEVPTADATDEPDDPAVTTMFPPGDLPPRRRRRWPLLVAVPLLFVAVCSGFAWWIWPEEASAPSAETSALAPEEEALLEEPAAPSVRPESETDSADPEAMGEEAPSSDAASSGRRPGRSSSAAQTWPPLAGAVARPDVSDPERSIRVRVTILSDPDSAVIIDGEPVGRTTWRGRLQTGRRIIKLLSDDGQEVTRKLDVEKGESNRFCWNFERQSPCDK